MRRSSKKAISLLLSLCMLLSILIMPIPVQAEGAGSIATMGPNPKYAIGQEVGVLVDDTDLCTDTVDVTVTSNLNPGGVVLSLPKDNSNPGKYSGKIMISSDLNDPGQPNRIQAENGDTITFSYNDGGEVRSTGISVANRVGKPSSSVDPLQPVKALEVNSVSNLYKGNNQIAIRFRNVSALNGDFSGLIADINTGSDVKHLAYDAETDRIEYHDNDAATWRLYDDSISGLDFGSLSITIKNGDDVIGDSRVTHVIQRIGANQEFTSLNNYQTTDTVLSFSTDNSDYPWNIEESPTLSATVRLENGTLECEPSVVVMSDNKLELTIPANASAAEGRRIVSIYEEGELLADWAKGYIKAAYDKGIISPYADGTFRPSQSITRAEMVEMLVKAMGLKPAGDAAAFKDQKDIPANVRPYVAKAAELNIIAGKGDGMFHPADSLTRAEASKVIIEMIEVLGKM